MPTAFAGSFFDGRSSRAHSVQVQLDDGGGALVIEGEEIGRLRFPLERIKVSPRIGDTPRFLYLDGGASLEVGENDVLDGLATSLPGGRFHLAQHRLESKRPWILAMLALAIGIGWATITYGLPYLAEKAAFALPREVDERLGRGALAALDDMLFEPTALDAGTRARLQGRFEEMVARSDLEPSRIDLMFRASPVMGANALALPSGIVVMTDELVRLAESEDEVLAVLAHEIGHIRHRHSLRGVLQNSAVALMVASLTGDLASLTSISAALPTLLVQMNYSRGFELEADDYAIDMLNGMGIAPKKLGDILLRMTDEGAGEMPDYLSTHPGSEERMKRITGGM